MSYKCVKECFINRRYRIGEIVEHEEVVMQAPKCFVDAKGAKVVEVIRKGVALSELKGQNIEQALTDADEAEKLGIKRGFAGKWTLPNGDIIKGKFEDAKAAWLKIQEKEKTE